MNKISPWWLVLIVVAYLVIGALYAVYTPRWQVPDEPAHYNYIRTLATTGRFPVIEAGDYDQEYLTRLVFEQHFPPSMSIEPVSYEDWQPPLYYLLAVPVFWVTGGSLIGLRLFSVLLGAGVILLAFLVARQVLPAHPTLAAGTAAFVAFVPQHVAMLAGVNNDGLAELLLAAVMLSAFRMAAAGDERSRWDDVLLGTLVGLGMITKLTFYIALPVVLWAIAERATRNAQPAPRSAFHMPRFMLHVIPVALPALLIALPWWWRNLSLYGWPDFMGQLRHNAVVVGQPTLMDWGARYGWVNLLERFFTFTFQSFWGQFGWMTVLMPPRYYRVLGLLSLVALTGFIWAVAPRLKSLLTRPLFQMLGAWVVLNVLMYLYYNMTFVQHQGRYLFPALIPIGLAFTVGLRRWSGLLPLRWRHVVLALPYLGLAGLDLIALFRIIIPMLR